MPIPVITEEEFVRLEDDDDVPSEIEMPIKRKETAGGCGENREEESKSNDVKNKRQSLRVIEKRKGSSFDQTNQDI